MEPRPAGTLVRRVVSYGLRAVAVIAVLTAPLFLLYVFAKRSESLLFEVYFTVYLAIGYYLVYRVVSPA